MNSRIPWLASHGRGRALVRKAGWVRAQIARAGAALEPRARRLPSTARETELAASSFADFAGIGAQSRCP